MRGLRLLVLMLAAIAGAVAAADIQAQGAQSVWDRAYDATQEQRFIPLQLIIGGQWDGRQSISYPEGQFTEAFDPGVTWSGPHQWQNPRTGEMRMVYERLRGGPQGTKQIFAVRHDRRAFGRIADPGAGIAACDDTAKFPIGRWRQGEVRKFDSVCWSKEQTRFQRTTIIIQEIDYSFRGIDHCLRMEWLLQDKADDSVLEHRIYVLAPGQGIIFEQDL